MPELDAPLFHLLHQDFESLWDLRPWNQEIESSFFNLTVVCFFFFFQRCLWWARQVVSVCKKKTGSWIFSRISTCTSKLSDLLYYQYFPPPSFVLFGNDPPLGQLSKSFFAFLTDDMNVNIQFGHRATSSCALEACFKTFVCIPKTGFRSLTLDFQRDFSAVYLAGGSRFQTSDRCIVLKLISILETVKNIRSSLLCPICITAISVFALHQLNQFAIIFSANID